MQSFRTAKKRNGRGQKKRREKEEEEGLEGGRVGEGRAMGQRAARRGRRGGAMDTHASSGS